MLRTRKGTAPLLGQGGVDAPSEKWSPSFEGAAGVVRSTTDNRWLEPTTPSAPAKEAARHFVNGRSHPSLAKEGSFCEYTYDSNPAAGRSRDSPGHRHTHLRDPRRVR